MIKMINMKIFKFIFCFYFNLKKIVFTLFNLLKTTLIILNKLYFIYFLKEIFLF